MPLSPSHVHDHSVNSRLTIFQEVCIQIDSSLMESYDGERPINVSIDMREEHIQDGVLIAMIIETYNGIGWEVNKRNDSLVFNETSTESYGQPFVLPPSLHPYR